MMITAWRIVKAKYADLAFSGLGAKEFGGRWNPVGLAAVSTADSLSLAILELIVHLEDYIDIAGYVAIPIQFDDSMVIEWSVSDLPENWMKSPAPDACRQLGRKWLEAGKRLVLKVPSAVVPQQHNYIINPLHPDYKTAAIGSALANPVNMRLIKNKEST